ncbi:trypsin, alkaline B-like [Copidosoma floridanum]|uniref:trypsin, alkaline B-like n=1 Tax=Copidosoma floridanum TaxID=29053 RepID=UPI0006C9D3BF|nr:trypsin, alkaline B-like [Copidosoma floridanum]
MNNFWLVIVSIIIAHAPSQKVGAANPTVEYHPYIASLEAVSPDENNGNTSTLHCTGFIVSQLHAVFSCLCVKTKSNLDLRVRVGSDSEDKGTLIGTKNYTCHDEYSRYVFTKNDIAVVELATPVTFGPNIQKIGVCDKLLGPDETPASPFAVTFKLRYLQTPTNGSDNPGPAFRPVEYPVMSKNQCKSEFEGIFSAAGSPYNARSLLENQMCTGNSPRDGQNNQPAGRPIFHGGRGSPLVVGGAGGAKCVIGLDNPADMAIHGQPFPRVFEEAAVHRSWIGSLVGFG